MALEGLLALVCAGTVLVADPGAGSSAPVEKVDAAVATTLAVQNALQQGREHLLHSEYQAAVTTLESQLPFINGNKVYLKVLQDAYRGLIKELRLARQETEARRFLKRLAILDKGAVLDYAEPAPASSAAVPSKPAPTVRLQGDDEGEDAFHARQQRAEPPARVNELLVKADQEFSRRHYREAKLLYEEAHRVDEGVTDSCRERWAYCKLYQVVEQLNQAELRGTSWNDLEKEVRLALDLAPRLEFGKKVLDEIERRRTGSAVALGPNEAAGRPSAGNVAGRRNAQGWLMTESANCVIYHNQDEDLAMQAATVVEKTRASMSQKWFGGTSSAWTPKCEIYLHATAQDYGRATGQYNSPGHSSIRMENGRLVVRRIDLHCDDPNMLTAILPHEATHVVLASEFGEQLVPRWADEGVAVLTEPREKIERHLANLQRCRQNGQLFRLQDLLQLSDYPQDPRSIGAFYAQSVSVVEYLASLKGPQEFSLFLQEGLRYGYEKALERHFDIRGFGDLERRWQAYAYANRVAERTP